MNFNYLHGEQILPFIVIGLGLYCDRLGRNHLRVLQVVEKKAVSGDAWPALAYPKSNQKLRSRTSTFCTVKTTLIVSGRRSNDAGTKAALCRRAYSKSASI